MTPDVIAKSIPDDVVEAAARALCKEDGRIPDAVIAPDGLRGFLAWEQYKPKARAALAAGLVAWPKVFVFTFPGSLEGGEESSQDLILPLKKGDV